MNDGRTGAATVMAAAASTCAEVGSDLYDAAGRPTRSPVHNLNRLDIDASMATTRTSTSGSATSSSSTGSAGSEACRAGSSCELGAAGALALAAGPALAHGHRPRAGAGRPDRQAAAARVVHRAGHERGDALGGDAPARATSRPTSEVLRPQPHRHAGDRRRATWRLQRLRQRPAPTRRAVVLARRPARLPSREHPGVIECAGNGRSLFGSQQGTPAAGSAWKLGAIGVARWRGVPLREVLERAGITRRAVDVLPEGLDATVVAGGADQGHVRRPLPVEKALDDALLAYEMNGAPLPPDHGFPVRLVVPGWIGIASIKWLGRIEVADRPLFSLLEHDPVPDGRPGLPARRAAADDPAGQERVRAALGRRASPPAARGSPAARGRAAGRSGASRCGSTGRAARVPSGARACTGRTRSTRGCAGRSTPTCARRASTRCWRARPTATASRSRTRCRSTRTATSSGPSRGTRSP